jgi:hypothetical protein
MAEAVAVATSACGDKSEHCCRANATLITDEAAEGTRGQARRDRPRTGKSHALANASQLKGPAQQEQGPEHGREDWAREACVEDGAKKTTDGAGKAKRQKNISIDRSS